MSAADTRPIVVGDRFEDKDWRNEGRIVKVVEKRLQFVKVEVEVHPNNPVAIGRRNTVHESTLRTRYRRVSR